VGRLGPTPGFSSSIWQVRHFAPVNDGAANGRPPVLPSRLDGGACARAKRWRAWRLKINEFPDTLNKAKKTVDAVADTAR
jgi:hypothetical protein